MPAPWPQSSLEETLKIILGDDNPGPVEDPSEEILDQYVEQLMDAVLGPRSERAGGTHGRSAIYVARLYWFLRQHKSALRYMPQIYEVATHCGGTVQTDLADWCTDHPDGETREARTAAYWKAAEAVAFRDCGQDQRARKLKMAFLIIGLNIYNEPVGSRRLLDHYQRSRARLHIEYCDLQQRWNALTDKVPGIDLLRRMSEITVELEAIPLP